MRLPDFLIIGAQKSGTSWLADQLGRHPSVYMAPDEVHFFDKEQNWNRGLAWYAEHFAQVPRGIRAAEKTPDYLWANGDGAEGHLPDVHRNLHRTLPDAKLLVVLRNPVDRALSALTHLIRTRRISPSHPVDELLLGRKHELIRGHGVIKKGLYYRQLAAFAELYDRRQIQVLIFEEDIAKFPADGLRQCCQFLGISPMLPEKVGGSEQNASRRTRLRLLMDFYFPPARPVSKVLDRVGSPWKPRPSSRTMAELYDIYRVENEKLFRWLGRPMPSSWDRRDELLVSSLGDQVSRGSRESRPGQLR